MNSFKLFLVWLFLSAGLVISAFGEPDQIIANADISADTPIDSGINGVSGLTIHEAFELLRSDKNIAGPDALRKSIEKVFGYRKTETLDYLKNYMRSPLQAKTGELSGKRVRDFNLARQIFETFPEDAVPMLISLYDESDAVIKGNVIRAAGRVTGGKEVDELLLQALDDKGVYDEYDPDAMGDPLRICDLAYNQLVLRHRIKNVLRTISPGHRVEVRDRHIDILKAKLK